MLTPAEIGGRIALLVGSVLLTLAGLELGCRLVRGPHWLAHWPNLVRWRQIEPIPGGENSFVPDATLGAAPKPGFSSDVVNYDSHGYRVTPPLPPGAVEAPPIVATGDSYTHGDEVRDDEAWPAYLQKLMLRRVVNAGVPGYGLDQAVLRAELAAAALRPAALVVSFIADDIWRTEMRRLWGMEKPYFALDPNGALVLHNVPVPELPDQSLSIWQRTFGWSMLAETILRRVDRHDEWTSGNIRALPPEEGAHLACPLMRRLAGLGVPTLVVAQYEPAVWTSGRAYGDEQHRSSQLVLQCAADAGLSPLDLYEQTARAVGERGLKAVYLDTHHSAEGNRLVAEAIAAELRRRHLPATEGPLRER